MNRRDFIKRTLTAFGLAIAWPLMPSVGRAEPTIIAFGESALTPEVPDIKFLMKWSTSVDGDTWSEWGNFPLPPERPVHVRIRWAEPGILINKLDEAPLLPHEWLDGTYCCGLD